jgi:hypothetical protein
MAEAWGAAATAEQAGRWQQSGGHLKRSYSGLFSDGGRCAEVCSAAQGKLGQLMQLLVADNQRVVFDAVHCCVTVMSRLHQLAVLHGQLQHVSWHNVAQMLIGHA